MFFLYLLTVFILVTLHPSSYLYNSSNQSLKSGGGDFLLKEWNFTLFFPGGGGNQNASEFPQLTQIILSFFPLPHSLSSLPNLFSYFFSIFSISKIFIDLRTLCLMNMADGKKVCVGAEHRMKYENIACLQTRGAKEMSYPSGYPARWYNYSRKFSRSIY